MTRGAIKDGHKVVMSKESFKKMQKQAYDFGYREADGAKSLFDTVFGERARH